MRILLTGGTGFIGQHIVARRLRDGHRVRLVSRKASPSHVDPRIEWKQGDLCDATFVASLIDGIDEVIHLASHRKNVSYHRSHADDVRLRNEAMSKHLVDALRAAGSRARLFFMSSANVPEGIPLPTNDGFVAGKAAAERLWSAFGAENNVSLLIIRPVAVYGPGDRFARDGNVIPSLIVKASEDSSLEVWGDGSQLRSFLYVDDVVEAVMRLRATHAEGIHSMASPEVVTIKTLAELIRSIIRPDLPIRFDAAQPGGSLLASGTPHPALLRFPWTTLGDGLRRTVAWYRTHSSAALPSVR